MMRFLLYSGLLLCQFFSLPAQEIVLNERLEGYWEGAVIRGSNSIQLITAEFYYVQDTLFVNTNIPEWTYYSPRKSKVDVNGDVIKFQTVFGPAWLLFDSTYTQKC